MKINYTKADIDHYLERVKKRKIRIEELERKNTNDLERVQRLRKLV